MAKHVCTNRFYGEGNNGGSFVDFSETDNPGTVRMRIGNHCVITIDQEISAVALAHILTAAKDEGFAAVLKRTAPEWDYSEIPSWFHPF